MGYKDRAVETASIQTKPELRGVEDGLVKITLFSSVRGGGHRLCRRGFNRRLILGYKDRAVETASIQTKPELRGVEDGLVKITLFSSVRGGGHRLCRRGFNRRLIRSQINSKQTNDIRYNDFDECAAPRGCGDRHY